MTMNFQNALTALKTGCRVARTGWNGKGMWLRLMEFPEQVLTSSDLTGLRLLPWIGMKTADNGFVPWLASQTDILATDWEIVA